MRGLPEPRASRIQLPDVLMALADPLRLRIVKRLAERGEQACGTFDLPASKATLSHHFKVLREAGLTGTRAVGTKRYIHLRGSDIQIRFPGLLPAILGIPTPRRRKK